MTTATEQNEGATIDATIAGENGFHIPGLLPHHYRELRASGLSEETIRAAGIHSETTYTVLASLLDWRKVPKRLAPAIVFPFKNALGQNGYSRIKPDNPRTLGGRVVKYESPRGQGNQVYFPPSVTATLEEPATPLYVTEGEKKSLKATQDGFPCIGLVGVYGWKDGRSERLLPGLERITWKGRSAVIVFDSDAADKAEIQVAEARLAKHLQDRGANVRILRLPPAADGAKQGLDDYLVAHGAAAFADLVRTEAAEPGTLDEPSASTLLSATSLEPAQEAKAYLERHKTDGKYRLRFWMGTWWYWRGGCYREIEASEVSARLVQSINQNYERLTTGILGNVVMQLKAQSILGSHITPPAWLDEPPRGWPAADLLATRRELVYLPALVAGEPHSVPATPKYFSTSALDYDFDIEAPPPKLWLDFLASELWPDDPASVETLQEWSGYLLTGDTRQQKMLLLIGPPRSGKGTIARILTDMLGRANVSGPTLASLEGNFGLAPLLGKSAAIISDARLSGKTDQSKIVERLLAISGEDPLDAERKFKEPISGKIPARITIISNELPRFAETSGALANRMIVLRLTNSWLGRENTTLTDQLRRELPGILLWAIEGWRRLRERGHFVQPPSGDELFREMRDLTSPVSMFLRERCEVGAACEAVVDDVYASWCDWCKANGRDHYGTKQTFGRDLRAAVPTLAVGQHRDGSERLRFYVGLRLKRFGE